MQLADRLLDRGVEAVRGLEQQAEFRLFLHGLLPAIDAEDLRDLRTGGKLAPDERARQPLGIGATAEGRDDGNRRHASAPGARSPGTMTTLRSSVPAITERLTPIPMRCPASSRTR